MSHYFESGFCVRQPAWHGLAKVLDEYPGSWEEARKHAGLEWEPVVRNVYALGADETEDGDPTFAKIEGWKQIARSDTGATLSLAKNSYAVIDHSDMGGIIEAVLEQPNVKYETAGSVEEGRAVWCLAYLDEPMEVPGDNSLTLPYLTILNRHDGAAACRLQPTSIRVVCANTFKAAEIEGDAHGAVFSFRHSANWRDRVEDAKEAIRGARQQFEEYAEVASHLSKIVITPEQTEKFIVEFIPRPQDALVSDRVMNNVEEARGKVRDLLHGPTTATISHTAYGLMQAAGEYLDHMRWYQSPSTLMGRTMLRPEPMKRRALNIIREVVNA